MSLKQSEVGHEADRSEEAPLLSKIERNPSSEGMMKPPLADQSPMPVGSARHPMAADVSLHIASSADL